MSDSSLSADTQAILLLCGRFGGERGDAYQPLSPRDYAHLATWLRASGLRPSSLLQADRRGHLEGLSEAKLDPVRVEFLLGRGTAMAIALERWERAGLWVISRGDADFPSRLKRIFKNAAPPLLYGCGNRSMLDGGGLAIVGSRDASERELRFTRSVAERCAREQLTVISGGARGVDSAAMQGATESGGQCIGVLASDLLKSCLNRHNRIGLQEGNLLLVSPYFPEAGFNAGNAMGRNRYIYGLADYGLVVDSALERGGTWEGAVEDLRNAWVPLFVRIPGDGAGNQALLAKGGMPFPDDMSGMGSLKAFFSSPGQGPTAMQSQTDESVTQTLLPPTDESLATQTIGEGVSPEDDRSSSAAAVQRPEDACSSAVSGEEASGSAEALVDSHPDADSLDLFSEFTRRLTLVLAQGPRSLDEIAVLMSLEKSQTKVWLERALQSGQVRKLMKPVRFEVSRQPPLC